MRFAIIIIQLSNIQKMSLKPDSNNNNAKHATILMQIEATNRKSQDLMLKTLEQIMPEYYNFSQLATIFEKNQTQPLPLHELNYIILKYFAKTISENCINMKDYQLLEEQAQKLEATIRSHIKVQQEMKMYLDYLESKINSYEAQLNKSEQQDRDKADYINQVQVLKSKESILMKQKIALLKRNEQLIRQIQKKNQQIKILQHKPKTDNFILHNIPFHNPNQVSNMTQISNVEMRRTESPLNGPYSYRKVQPQNSNPNPNQNTFMRQIRQRQGYGIIPNRSYHQFNIENMSDIDKIKNFESHMIRKSNGWQQTESKRKKTEQIVPGNAYQSANSEDERGVLFYRQSCTQGDRIVQQQNESGFKKIAYDKIHTNLKSSLRKINLRQQEIQKDRSMKSQQYSSQKVNPNQMGRRIEIKKFQTEHPHLVQKPLQSQHQKFNMNQASENQQTQNRTSQILYQDSRNKQMSFTEGTNTKHQKIFQISIAGNNKSSSKHPMVNHLDHQITQKKSSNPLPQNFYSHRGQNNNQTSQQQKQSIVHPHYIRLQGSYKH